MVCVHIASKMPRAELFKPFVRIQMNWKTRFRHCLVNECLWGTCLPVATGFCAMGMFELTIVILLTSHACATNPQCPEDGLKACFSDHGRRRSAFGFGE